MKVAEPLILAKLHAELLAPSSIHLVTTALERELKRAASEQPMAAAQLDRRLAEERRKLQNLVSAIEGGSHAPASLLAAISSREAAIKRLENELRQSAQKPPKRAVPNLSNWVSEQLQDLTALLKDDPAKTKAEFRRLNLQLTFTPTEAKPRPHYVVSGQCDLSALAFSSLVEKSARLDRMLGNREAARNWLRVRSTI
jgi:septal ring factor EnvC (AmiA/AmiB activator)